jgi:hypothetical protein
MSENHDHHTRDHEDQAERQLRANARGMTRLLVKIHLDDRARLTRAAEITNSSQQSLIRNGICLILHNILDDPRARRAGEPSPAPASPPSVHSLDALLGAIREDQRGHGAVARMASTSARTVTITFADGWKNQYDTPGSRDIAGMNEALRVAFPAATTKLFRGGAA